jgi:hypothetical protein
MLVRPIGPGPIVEPADLLNVTSELARLEDAQNVHAGEEKALHSA